MPVYVIFFFMLEEILDYRNIHKALGQVKRNRGAGGVDNMSVDELPEWLQRNWINLKNSILKGGYRPAAVRKVEIPKANGRGRRLLGIPTVTDRLLQQAIAQWLTPHYDPYFSKRSYGFRRGRNAHQAVVEAKTYLEEGKVWIAALDLDQFFDRVNHDKLMGRLSHEVKDKRTLKLIRLYLNSGIMEGGLVSMRTEGVPQGSPLSPLLSNIVLDQLDKELESRGHRFVRYADDVSIYVGSKRAAERVLCTVGKYLEKELKLKVNFEKSQVGKPGQNTLLGFSFWQIRGKWEIVVSRQSLKRIKDKLRKLTKRNDPANVCEKAKKLEVVVGGWVNYFRLAHCRTAMKELDSMVRHRLRMCIWKQWKTPQNRIRNLRRLGIGGPALYHAGKSSSQYCRIANNKLMKIALTNAALQRAGYIGFCNHHYRQTTHQINLF